MYICRCISLKHYIIVITHAFSIISNITYCVWHTAFSIILSNISYYVWHSVCIKRTLEYIGKQDMVGLIAEPIRRSRSLSHIHPLNTLLHVALSGRVNRSIHRLSATPTSVTQVQFEAFLEFQVSKVTIYISDSPKLKLVLSQIMMSFPKFLSRALIDPNS